MSAWLKPRSFQKLPMYGSAEQISGRSMAVLPDHAHRLRAGRLHSKTRRPRFPGLIHERRRLIIWTRGLFDDGIIMRLVGAVFGAFLQVCTCTVDGS